jgi:23S rRNA (cytosine1962-C5)-methyltransferase
MTRRGLRPDVRPTEARRLVNAEGDGLPGLTIDLFGAVAVVQISTLPMAHRRSVLMQAIQDVFRPDTVLMADPERAGELEGFEAQRGWWGPEPSSPTSFVDGGLNYLLDFRALQKTGHYLDVREHRKWVADRVAARSIFDGYCFTGGFSLAAAAAGATRALGVDSSESAIELATQNARVMGLSDRVEFVRSDVFDKLRSCADLKQTFNFVVLDPPKFAPRARDRNKATEAYGALAREGLRVLAPGGILGLSSCSHHVGEDDLVRAIAAASARRGRSLDVVHVGSHDGDHPYPAAMSEGRYLTFVFCQERCG